MTFYILVKSLKHKGKQSNQQSNNQTICQSREARSCDVCSVYDVRIFLRPGPKKGKPLNITCWEGTNE